MQVAEEDIEAWQISGAMTNIIFRCQNLKTCQVSFQLYALMSALVGDLILLTINTDILQSQEKASPAFSATEL